MHKVLIANWKMNPAKDAEAVRLAKATDAAQVIICPPFPFLGTVARSVVDAQLGAQDVYWESAGAHTGEVSADELISVGVRFVIIGHSERRALGETDEQVAKKVAAAVMHGITPIVCIGESALEKEAGSTQSVVERQLRSALSLLPADTNREAPPQVYIAYEPVWAISTNQVAGGAAATPEEVRRVIHYMQGVIRGAPVQPVFLYGGSVTAATLAGFLDVQEIGGALVGGASLKPAEFKKLIQCAASYH